MDLVNKIYKHYEDKQARQPREHLGASLIGEECNRKIWYSWRWAKYPNHSGRMLLLFERGNMEEARIIRHLESVGITVSAEKDGKQHGFVGYMGHYAGSCDGIINDEMTLLECKTHNQKSFNHLVKYGVKKSKPEHYAQMQSYMHNMGLIKALYFAVCKNNDEIYTETVEYDSLYAQSLNQKAKFVIDSTAAPYRFGESEEYYVCKMCDFAKVCWKREVAETNCRTCAHSTPINGGKWMCEMKGAVLSVQEQLEACEAHLFVPDFFPGEPVDGGPSWIQYTMSDGTTYVDGSKE